MMTPHVGETLIGSWQHIIDLTATEREVELTTWGRNTGQPQRVIVWIWGDGHRLYVRSGGGIGRDWPRNLLARPDGILHLATQDVSFRARHVTDPAEARSGAGMINAKYGAVTQPSPADAPLSLGEQATFELTPLEIGRS